MRDCLFYCYNGYWLKIGEKSRIGIGNRKSVRVRVDVRPDVL